MEPQKPAGPDSDDTKPQSSWPPAAAGANDADTSKWPETPPSTPNMPASADPASAPSSTSAPVTGMTPGSKKKAWIIGAIIAGVILLVGGVAAAYFGYYLPNKPENVMKSALANTFSNDKVQSVHFSGAFDVSGEASEQNLSFTYTGKSNNTGALELSGEMDAVLAKVTLDIRSLDGKTFYLKVGGLSGLSDLLALSGSSELAPVYGPVLTAIDDQWIEVSESLIEQFAGTQPFQTLSDEDLKKLAQAYDQYPFLIVKEELPDEQIKGVDSFHYQVVVDKTLLKGFLQTVKDANISSLPLDSEQLTYINEGIDGTDFSKYPFDLWIAKDTKLINQIVFKVSEEGATGEFRFTVDSYNTPVTVEKPEDAKPIMEIITELNSALTGTPAGANSLLKGLESGLSL